MTHRSLTITALLAMALPAVSLGQAPAHWDAMSGFLPADDVPRWDAFFGPYGSSSTCNGATEALSTHWLSVDTRACPEDVGLYRGGWHHVGFQTQPTVFVEARLAVVSSLGLSADDGPAAISLSLLGNCTWAVHVDANEVFLKHGTDVVGRIAMPTTPFRTYRLEVDPSTRTARMYINGIERIAYDASNDPPCTSASFRWVFWGDLSHDEGGLVDWISLDHNASHGFATFCDPEPNSAGRTPYTTYRGSRTISENDAQLRTVDLPANVIAYYLCSRGHTAPVMPPGSRGSICLSGPIGRFARAGEVLQSSPTGAVELDIDLGDLPGPTGALAVLPGDEWHFQLWYRDMHPGPTSNYSSAMQVVFE